MRSNVDKEKLFGNIDRFLASQKAAVFKVSGYGEVSLWPSILELVKRYSKCFPVVQVITNGTLNENLFEGLKSIENLVVTVTIDGHTMQMNSNRVSGNKKLHGKVLEFASTCKRNEIPLEINCVLSSANIDGFLKYIGYIKENFGSTVKVFPFPVRPFEGLVSSCRPASLGSIESMEQKLSDRYENFHEILPPVEYMFRMFEFMKGVKRRWKCYVPKLVYAEGPTLEKLICPCLGHTKPSENNNTLKGNLKPGKLDGVSFIDRRCFECFTHYEVLNLFKDGLISIKDLKRIPSFSLPTSDEVLTLLSSSSAQNHTVNS